MGKYRLDEICSLITDGTHQTPVYCGNEGYIFLSSKDVTSKKINWENVKYIPKELHDQLYGRLSPQLNDILLAKNGTTGVAAIVDKDEVFDIYVSLALLRPKNMVFPKFLLHFINSPVAKRQFNKGLKGIGVPNLHLNIIRETEISLPKIEEQKEISYAFDKITSILEKRNKQIVYLDNLIKSRFVEMFGDTVTNTNGFERKSIGNLCETILGGGTPSKAHPEYYGGTLPWVTPKDMKIKLINSAQVYINEEGISNSSAKLIPPNSILMVIRSGILKHTLPIAINSCEVAINQDMKAFVPKRNVNIDYLFYAIKGIEADILSSVRGVTADNIEFSIIRDYLVPIPPIDLQIQFATFVHHIDKLKFTIQRQLEETQQLFDALMQQYFG